MERFKEAHELMECFKDAHPDQREESILIALIK
jgi:hypothetical protein